MQRVYSPGCALMLYKPHLAHKITALLNAGGESIPEHHICCHHEPGLAPGTQIINTCAGCDRRFRSLYEGISTVSVWEELAESDAFPFPDYHGQQMAIHDACPIRSEKRVHDAVRALLARMNIRVVEPLHNREKSICCGDSLFGQVSVEKVKEYMKNRADEMPCEDVVVYCVSCVKAMHIGGKRPRHLVDLLFSEDTEIGVFEPEEWHSQIKEYIEAH